ncbi:hypothetical protein PanWU01x14_122150 [Parasponia andersonii]|uniref:Uncharacterized protein n=1 Tax=Parasponia andersonii TaxID=3476 RepID=A0A2P5CUM8_PARAD|nr:hypothetical protein PanWU01x14_122150 [Parasponia andersonii]
MNVFFFWRERVGSKPSIYFGGKRDAEMKVGGTTLFSSPRAMVIQLLVNSRQEKASAIRWETQTPMAIPQHPKMLSWIPRGNSANSSIGNGRRSFSSTGIGSLRTSDSCVLSTRASNKEPHHRYSRPQSHP